MRDTAASLGYFVGSLAPLLIGIAVSFYLRKKRGEDKLPGWPIIIGLVLTILSCVGATTPSKAAQVGNAIAMPIDDPKDASDGPALAAIWSGPCKTCTEAPDLHRAYEATRNAILIGPPGGRAALHPRKVIIISYAPPPPGGYGSYTDQNASLEAVHDRLQGCAIASQDMLPRPRNTDMDSYGIGLDCPGQETRVFMSLSFKNNQLQTVYLMPDRPFFVAMERG